MYCVGLTGHLASGKSTVARLFKALGIEIISADEIARELTANDQPLFQAIVTHFGSKVLNADNLLNRRYLRQLIFKQPEEREWLEQQLHPLIRHQIKERIPAIQSPFALIEIPLLRDRALYPYLNRVLLIDAPHEQQISRFMLRDNGTRADALTILATQPTKEKLRSLADDVLMNHGSLAELQEAVKQLHEQYIQAAQSASESNPS